MKFYLNAWLVVSLIAVAVGFCIGLWSTFFQDGKTYTRQELLFGEKARGYFGVGTSSTTAFALLWSTGKLIGFVFDPTNAWLGGSALAALIFLIVAATGSATYLAVRGALFFGYAVKSAIVELQCRWWDAKCEAEQQAIADSAARAVNEEPEEAGIAAQVADKVVQFTAEEPERLDRVAQDIASCRWHGSTRRES